jgi:hypothetical protein
MIESLGAIHSSAVNGFFPLKERDSWSVGRLSPVIGIPKRLGFLKRQWNGRIAFLPLAPTPSSGQKEEWWMLLAPS